MHAASPTVLRFGLLGAMTFYETVDHVKLDKGVLEACREAVAGVGDGRVSVDDAKKVGVGH